MTHEGCVWIIAVFSYFFCRLESYLFIFLYKFIKWVFEVASVCVLNHLAMRLYKNQLQDYGSEFHGLQKVRLR